MASARMEGPLSKWTNVMKGWQYRWFVLDDSAGLLSYYTSKEKMMRGARRGCVRLKGAIIGIDDVDDSTFTVTVDGKVFHFQARDAEEREKWVRAMEDTILRHAHMTRPWDMSRPIPTMKDFDQKLVETDAYLQILIDQVKNLEIRMDKCEDEEEKAKVAQIRDRSNEMLESIKHSIVLLQITKNTAFPIVGVFQGAADINNLPRRISNKQVVIPPLYHTSGGLASIGLAPIEDIEDIQPGIELASECKEREGRGGAANRQGNTGMVAVPTKSLPVPPTSYSSSEEEDMFFDATDGSSTRSQSISLCIGFEDDLGLIQHMKEEFAPIIPTMMGGLDNSIGNGEVEEGNNDIDYDAMYENSSDDEVSMMGHGSVISHLLSQVKIGMDLTKVVLPTFILERRSLLEMYADFFAHPDIFVSIPDYKDPRSRMVQVVRWYLSAFHAGRKSTVAKKPYNPILGETFRCHWDIPKTYPPSQRPPASPLLQRQRHPSSPNMSFRELSGLTEDNSDTKCVSDGPVPWCHQNQLTFIAEQVSHHPPVSAFYAEHYNKRISLNAHIYTKSKFLGLSVAVLNIGQAVVNVTEYGEEYTLTFPNGYGRSILTVPWVELGGNVTISCPNTGYSATVEFHTKPFYGGKKNLITTEVKGPDKVIFLTVNGEWNGSMNAKWHDTGHTESFVDVSRLKIVKKIVKPVAEQLPTESRRLWKDVTAGLMQDNIQMATSAKFALEQRQREEAAARKQSNEEWKTKLFHPSGENWEYCKLLQQRLSSSPRNS